MSSYSRITPEGTRDILFEERRAQREAQARLSRLFSLRGYREVLTPGVEYYDVFRLPGAAIPQQEMYKTTDNHGRLIAFRPDSTLPIARMAASRLQNEPRPLRLFYDQSIFRNRPDLSGRSDECAQMGVEMLGAGGLKADIEALSLAAEALSACTEDFRIEIGDARLFKAVAARLTLSEEKKETLRAAIESKNYGALSELLDPLGDDPAARAMKRLPRLFGGEEVFEEARRWLAVGEAEQVLYELESFFAALKSLGLGDRLMADLGLVQPNDYYTGVVFSAYVPGRGDAVLSGGRYDGLCEKFGAPMPAIGFALDLDAAAVLLTGSLPPAMAPEVLLHGEPGYEVRAQQLSDRMTAEGRCCEISVFSTCQEALDYARRRGVVRVLRVSDEITEYPVEEGEA